MSGFPGGHSIPPLANSCSAVQLNCTTIVLRYTLIWLRRYAGVISRETGGTFGLLCKPHRASTLLG